VVLEGGMDIIFAKIFFPFLQPKGFLEDIEGQLMDAFSQ
jgi:hypothetical protein